MKRIFITMIILTMGLVFDGPTYAELYNRGTDSLGNRLIYDSVLDITWYDHTESSAGWTTQNNWAENLTVNFNGTTFDDWRLTIVECSRDSKNNCSSIGVIELEYLFLELGNTLGSSLTNSGPFNNLYAGSYVTGTYCCVDPGPMRPAYYVYDFGGDGLDWWGYPPGLGIAVRSGDVTVVPEPISSILFVVGGTLLGGRRFLKRK